MRTPTELLTEAVRKGIPGAVASVALDGGKYDIIVKCARFSYLARSEREALVYQALGHVPLELLARVAAITCEADPH